MASIINAATSGGLVTTADTSGILQLQTAGTTAVTVDASQNVTLVGTLTAAGNITTNGGKFSLKSASVEYGSFSTASGDATLTSAASGYLKLVADGALLIGSAAGGEVFRGSSTGLRLTNSLGVGGTAPSASGAGITFPATQSASSDANTLDDYEEGTWTPTVTLNTGTGTNYTIGTATYTKTGRVVVVIGSIIPTNGTFGSTNGYARMTGLPFTCATRVGTGSGCNSSALSAAGATTVAYSTTLDVAFVSGVVSTNEFAFTATYFV